MLYLINGTSLSDYGAIPAPHSGTHSALKGMFDFPRRKGKTEKEWGSEIEAFTQSDDLEFYGRKHSLKVYIKGSSMPDLISKINAFAEAFKNGEVDLTTPYGIYTVVLKENIITTVFRDLFSAHMTVNLWEDTYVIPALTLNGSGGTGYRIDDINLRQDLGVVIESKSGHLDTPHRLDVKPTAPDPGSAYRKPRDITLKCSMLCDDLMQLNSRMQQLHALIGAAGMHTFTTPDGSTHEVYFKDGMTVSKTILRSKPVVQFYLKMREPNP